MLKLILTILATLPPSPDFPELRCWDFPSTGTEGSPLAYACELRVGGCVRQCHLYPGGEVECTDYGVCG